MALFLEIFEWFACKCNAFVCDESSEGEPSVQVMFTC